MKKEKVRPQVFGRSSIHLIGESARKAVISEDGTIKLTYHGPAHSGDRGELISGHHRKRKEVPPLLTGEKQGNAFKIYHAAGDNQIAEYKVGWQGQSEGGELHTSGRLIRWTRKIWQYHTKIKLVEGDAVLASLKMKQSFFSGLLPCGEILWHTADIKNLADDQELVKVIIFIASQFVTSEFLKNQKLVAGIRGGGIGAGIGLM